MPSLRNSLCLVTGADGFIGSHLVEALLAEGANVRAFVCYNSFNSRGWLDTFEKSKLAQLEIFAGDVRDPHGVEAAMRGCDFVFHLAALIAIPFSYHSPDSYVDTNIRGTLNVLQAARALRTRKLIVTSTSEVYGTARYVPIDESHPMQAQSPYSASKIAADRLAESFHCSFGLPTVILRPFNTYGPRQSARALIPTVITQLLSGEDFIQLGNTTPTRDWNFVSDTVAGFLAAMASDATVGEEINLATGVEYSVGDVARMLIERINPRAEIVCDDQRVRPVHSEVERLLGCTKKVQTLTDWKPTWSLEKGLDETIAWFRKPVNLAGYKAGIYNL
ncbi:MAG: NAD-dependent 4,6-dehydratase LegB [Akkermansiaceae bacterium]